MGEHFDRFQGGGHFEGHHDWCGGAAREAQANFMAGEQYESMMTNNTANPYLPQYEMAPQSQPVEYIQQPAQSSGGGGGLLGGLGGLLGGGGGGGDPLDSLLGNVMGGGSDGSGGGGGIGSLLGGIMGGGGGSSDSGSGSSGGGGSNWEQYVGDAVSIAAMFA